MKYAIEALGVTKEIGRLKILKNSTVKIPVNSTYALIGPTGCGKTTLLRILLGVVPPTSGQARIMGYDSSTERDEISRQVGYVPQFNALAPYLSAYDNARLFSSAYGLDKEEQKRRIESYLKYVGLQGKKDRLAKYLSGGESKLLAVICSLIHDPPVLIFDEATVSLDLRYQQDIWNLMKDFHKRKTIITVTHNMLEVRKLCDGAVLMNEGHILAVGQPKNLTKKFKCKSLEEVMIKLVSSGPEKT